MQRYLVLVVVIGVLAYGCGGEDSDRAENGDSVAVHYVGTLDDGSQFDSSREREPLVFEVGTDQVIAGFDIAVKGLSVGDVKTTEIQPSDGYGEWDETRVIELPIAPKLAQMLDWPGAESGAVLAQSIETGTLGQSHKPMLVNLVARIRPDALVDVAAVLAGVDPMAPGHGLATVLGDLATTRHRMLDELSR